MRVTSNGSRGDKNCESQFPGIFVNMKIEVRIEVNSICKLSSIALWFTMCDWQPSELDNRSDEVSIGCFQLCYSVYIIAGEKFLDTSYFPLQWWYVVFRK